MLLRRSGEEQNDNYDVTAVVNTQVRSGVEHGEILLALTDVFLTGSSTTLAKVRDEAATIIGPELTINALSVACGFNGITRVANATGIPLDPGTEESTIGMRAKMGIDSYAEDSKSALYDLEVLA